MKHQILALAVSSLLVPALAIAQQNEAKKQLAEEKDTYVERMQIISHKGNLRTESGSATLIGEQQLENFEFDDINRVLSSVPGVNIREEDGYGLRPNIGFRGVTPERSKKIAIMEDGVLIGPAPYSAPAAYYFPMVSRMTAIEVFKGPAAIKYGPNTVAGALNMTTRQVPAFDEGMLDLSLGADGYMKAHSYYGDTRGNFGFVIEGLRTEADGFKELDGGGDTGFEKNELLTKFRYNMDGNDYNQVWELKLAYSDETSNETYMGLSDQDLAVSPYRRYAATQADVMDWEHSQVQLNHFIEFESFNVSTKVYRNDFERSWQKLNNFNNSAGIDLSLQQILTNPEIYQDYYLVLSGAKDTEIDAEELVVGTNAREYYSQGIQSEAHWKLEAGGFEHQLEIGLRFHQDEILRDHFVDTYLMRSGQMKHASEVEGFLQSNLDAFIQSPTTVNREKTDAVSVFVQDTIELQDLSVTMGVRGEFIDSTYQNRKSGMENDWLTKSARIWLPGISAFYKLSDEAGLLFGVYEGFVPTSPQESPDVRIENSVNYEFGGRYANNGTKFELVAFYNDFSNLKESCTFSASSSCSATIDKEYNGGEVEVFGVELTAGHNFKLNGAMSMPVSFIYTHTSSEFNNSFTSDFPMWGTITAGDELPYLADNTATLNIGVHANDWQVNLMTKYVGEMKEAAGTGTTLSGITTESLVTVDLAASYDLGEVGSVYLKVDNLLDEVAIISRRPFGARPSKPQQAFIGYKYLF